MLNYQLTNFDDDFTSPLIFEGQPVVASQQTVGGYPIESHWAMVSKHHSHMLAEL